MTCALGVAMRFTNVRAGQLEVSREGWSKRQQGLAVCAWTEKRDFAMVESAGVCTRLKLRSEWAARSRPLIMGQLKGAGNE